MGKEGRAPILQEPRTKQELNPKEQGMGRLLAHTGRPWQVQSAPLLSALPSFSCQGQDWLPTSGNFYADIYIFMGYGLLIFKKNGIYTMHIISLCFLRSIQTQKSLSACTHLPDSSEEVSAIA